MSPYGAFPDNFGSAIDGLGMPDYRRRGCIETATRRGDSWKTLLRPHRRANVMVNPGDAPAEAKGGRITVDIQPSKTNEGALIFSIVAKAGFDKITDAMSSAYVLPRDTKFVMRDCGTVNSFYTPRDGSVTLCYEMFSYIIKLFNAYEGRAAPRRSPLRPAGRRWTACCPERGTWSCAARTARGSTGCSFSARTRAIRRPSHPGAARSGKLGAGARRSASRAKSC